MDRLLLVEFMSLELSRIAPVFFFLGISRRNATSYDDSTTGFESVVSLVTFGDAAAGGGDACDGGVCCDE